MIKNKLVSPKTIILTGVPGVGKTSLAEKIATNFQLATVNFGDVLFQKIRAKNLHINSVDEIRTKLPPKSYRRFQLSTAKAIKTNNKHQLITSHLSVCTPLGLMAGFPKHIIDILQPDMIIIVEAPLEEIVKRRQSDGSRLRGGALENLIELHQDFNRSLSADIAFHTGHHVFPVLNRQGHLEEAYEQIAGMMESLFFKPKL